MTNINTTVIRFTHNLKQCGLCTDYEPRFCTNNWFVGNSAICTRRGGTGMKVTTHYGIKCRPDLTSDNRIHANNIPSKTFCRPSAVVRFRRESRASWTDVHTCVTRAHTHVVEIELSGRAAATVAARLRRRAETIARPSREFVWSERFGQTRRPSATARTRGRRRTRVRRPVRPQTAPRLYRRDGRVRVWRCDLHEHASGVIWPRLDHVANAY